MTVSEVVGVLALALLQGGLVALPRADAFEPLIRLRSPAWAAVLPGSILVGTVGVLALPSMALALIVLACVATPLLAAIAAMAVVRRRRTYAVLLAAALALASGLLTGWLGELSGSILTALGCLAVGAAIVRLIP